MTSCLARFRPEQSLSGSDPARHSARVVDEDGPAARCSGVESPAAPLRLHPRRSAHDPAPMAAEGKDAVWSMGDDTPLAPLARAPRPVYAFFRQRFAQVTNPPIDPLREAVVLQMHTRLGPWPHLFEPREPLPGLSLRSPLLSLAQMHALKYQQHPLAQDLPLEILDCVFSPGERSKPALDRLTARAVELSPIMPRSCCSAIAPHRRRSAHSDGHGCWSGASPSSQEGVRTEVGLAVEAGDCRDIHHVAVLLGMGAGAVCPWLALETARTLTPENGEANTSTLSNWASPRSCPRWASASSTAIAARISSTQSVWPTKSSISALLARHRRSPASASPIEKRFVSRGANRLRLRFRRIFGRWRIARCGHRSRSGERSARLWIRSLPQG
jgi:hypothetical protein